MTEIRREVSVKYNRTESAKEQSISLLGKQVRELSQPPDINGQEQYLVVLNRELLQHRQRTDLKRTEQEGEWDWKYTRKWTSASQ